MKKIFDERGVVIVEATFVFPIMFLVIFLMLVVGNAYYQKCRVENFVNKCAIDGAAYCADPLLGKIEEGKKPSAADLNVQPYRYIVGGMSDIVDSIETRANKEIKGLSTGFFSGMQPKNTKVDADFNNSFIYATFSLEASYNIVMPVRLLFSKDDLKMEFSTRMEIPVTDVPEFIRNVDMVDDYLEVGKSISDCMDKIGDWK